LLRRSNFPPIQPAPALSIAGAPCYPPPFAPYRRDTRTGHRPDMTTEIGQTTPHNVAEIATERGTLDQRGVFTLLGIMGAEDALRALILLPSGKTVMTQADGTSSIGPVRAIDDRSVTLLRGGRLMRLELPA